MNGDDSRGPADRPRIGQRRQIGCLTALAAGLVALSPGLLQGQPAVGGSTPAERLNRGLSYAPWKDQCVGAGGPSGMQDLLRVLPGMRLRIVQSGLGSKGTQGEYPALSEVEWVIPSLGTEKNGPAVGALYKRLSPRDYVILAHLLGGAERDLLGRCIDDGCGEFPSGTLNGIDTSVGSAFGSRLDAYLKEVISSLAVRRWRAQHENQLGTKTASAFRQWMNGGFVQDFIAARSGAWAPGSRGSLVLARDNATEQILLDLAPRFANNPDRFMKVNPGELSGGKTRPWNAHYTDDYGQPRASVELEVPVSLKSDRRCRFVPVYWSIRDIERAWEVNVASLIRSPDWICAEVAAGVQIDEHGGIRITFKEQTELKSKAKEIEIPESAKEELLVAPRDVLNVTPNKRWPIERPEYR